MRCSKCGEENNNGKQICSVCGQSLSTRSSSSEKLKFSRWAIVGIIVAITFCLICLLISLLWIFDAAPIENDYKIDDLYPARTQFEETYEILKGLSCAEANIPEATGLTEFDIDVIKSVTEDIGKGDYSEISETLRLNADSVETAWKNGKKERAIIEKLSKYPGIADLTEPKFSAEVEYVKSIKHLALLYQAHICLQTIQGKSENVLADLMELNSVFRKLSVNARSMVVKLLCYAGMNICTETANFIVNNPATSDRIIRRLEEEFIPLQERHTSLYNPVVFEYLCGKKELQKHLYHPNNISSFALKPNSTLRIYRNIFIVWINRAKPPSYPESKKLDVYPSVYPNWLPSLNSEGEICRLYWCYNLVGAVMVDVMRPRLDKIFEIKRTTKTKDRLFHFVLSKRLEREAKLPADFEYRVDIEDKKIYSLGKDKTPDTSDDATLSINPKLLKLD